MEQNELSSEFFLNSIIENDYYLKEYFKNSSLYNITCKIASRIDSNNFSRDIEISLYRIYSIVDGILNTGHYGLIEEKYRIFFAFVSALCAKLEFLKGNYFKSLQYCDEGLLKGNDLSNKWLSSFAQFLCLFKLPKLKSPKNIEIKKKFFLLPLKNFSPIISLNRPSMSLFYSDYLNICRPLIIKGIVTEWPAFKKWSFSYFNDNHGHRTVPVELGLKYTDEDWCQKLMTINEFFKQKIFNKNSSVVGYLAQHRLFDQIPELWGDIIIPDYCLFNSTGSNNDLTLNIFIGPDGTISPLHCDPRHNLFCQVIGRKFVRMISPSYRENIALFSDSIKKNTSQIDMENPDLKKFPQFSVVKGEEVIIEPGDCLFIPRNYYHYVRSIDQSISVSIWFGLI